MVELSTLSCTVISRFVACAALQNMIRHSSTKRKRIRYLYIVKYPPLLVFYPIGSDIPFFSSEFRQGRHPVKEHSFHDHGHEMPPLFKGLLETPFPVCEDGKERFAHLDKFSFLCMKQDTGPPVMGRPGNTCKRDQGLVVHLDDIA